MEAASFVGNRGIKLPIGFRFHPTDEELISHYLKPKVLSLPLPASVIPEVEVFRANPWDLPGDLKERRYFFSRSRGRESVRINAGSGYWKAIDKEKFIIISASASNQEAIVGVKRTLAFFHGKSSGGLTSSWVMHQYQLVMMGPRADVTNNSIQKVEADWVVCRISQRKRRIKRARMINNNTINHFPKTGSMSGKQFVGEIIRHVAIVVKDIYKKDEEEEEDDDDDENDEEEDRAHDLLLVLPPPPQPSSSSCSSGITEDVSNFQESDDEEETSACSSLS